MMRHLTRSYHTYAHHISHPHAYHHVGMMAQHAPMHHASVVGGLGGMIVHSLVSFTVWHALGPMFRHAGIVGSLLGGIVLMAITYFILRTIRRFAT